MKNLLSICLLPFLLGCSDGKQQAKIDELEAQIKELKENQSKSIQSSKQGALLVNRKRPKIELLTSDSAMEQINNVEKYKAREIAIQHFQNELSRIQPSIEDYDSDGVGSLTNIILKMDNPTKYRFDYIAVNVTYIKANGDIYKTEKVYFYRVEPYSINLEKAPDSNRGIKLRAEIAELHGEEFQRIVQRVHTTGY